MSERLVPPDGFAVCRGPSGLLIGAERLLGALRAAGLQQCRTWRALAATAAGGAPGRGLSARLVLGDGTRLVLKQMRRGGLARRFWRDRFIGRARLLDNLRVPLEAAQRGIPTAAPAALLLVAGAGPLYRGWLAVEEIADAPDLATLYRRGTPPSERELLAVIALVRRMHEAGLVHRDLNLGNLLVRRSRNGEPEPFVIDMDRARFRAGALPFRLRQRSLRRLERSHAKLMHECGLSRADSRVPWYEQYAGEDRRLAGRLRRGRIVGRLLLALHEAGWRLRR